MGYYDPPDPPPDYCKWHKWEFDPDALPLVNSCPQCQAEFEEWEDGAWDRHKEEQMMGPPQEEPDYYANDDRD